MNNVAHQSVSEIDDIDARIDEIRSTKWIGYPKALQVLDSLEDLISFPKRHRMPNLMIIGSSNNGKTMLVRRFNDTNSYKKSPQGVSSIPSVVIECPPTPDESRLYNAILSTLIVPHKPHENIDKRKQQVIDVLKNIDLRILILDEIHNILSGHPTKQRQMLNAIKHLGNVLQIPIVAVGTIDALQALSTDPQLANRFDRFILDDWKLDKEFLRLLASFEKSLPLREASGLATKAMATKIYSMTEGLIGEVFTLLSKAAVYALRQGEEKISLKTLSEIQWIQPSKRKGIR